MVAASTHHVVRVTVRISAAPIYRSVDVSLPTSSTLSEVLPELARLIELPQTAGRPWEFATAAGAPLDPHVPLHNMRLRDGQVLALRPHEPVDPPVVRDAAESLAAAAAATTRSGIDTAATFAGAAAAGILTASLSAPLAGAAVTALLLLVIAVAARSRAVFPAAACAASAVCGAWVSGIHDGTGTGTWPPATDLAYGAMTACVIAAALTVGGAVLGLAGPRVTSAVLTSAALILAGSLAVWLPSPTAPYAAVVLAGIAAVMLTPSVATRAAGLRIPRVPTAGQEFGIADDYQDDVDARSDAARAITAGISVAAALCVIPALVVLARFGGGWVFALCLCTAGALIVHASRHHGTMPRLSLGSTAMLALTCGVTAVAVVDGAHPALLIAAGITALTAATAALWAARVPDLEPTTLVWLERAEAAAIIAVIPLAVKLTGIFDLIRGL